MNGGCDARFCWSIVGVSFYHYIWNFTLLECGVSTGVSNSRMNNNLGNISGHHLTPVQITDALINCVCLSVCGHFATNVVPTRVGIRHS
jgi:hypothetical protein